MTEIEHWLLLIQWTDFLWLVLYSSVEVMVNLLNELNRQSSIGITMLCKLQFSLSCQDIFHSVVYIAEDNPTSESRAKLGWVSCMFVNASWAFIGFSRFWPFFNMGAIGNNWWLHLWTYPIMNLRHRLFSPAKRQASQATDTPNLRKTVIYLTEKKIKKILIKN